MKNLLVKGDPCTPILDAIMNFHKIIRIAE